MRREGFLVLVVIWLACVSCSESSPVVRLATTTSTHNSGLLDEILPPFMAESGFRVQVFPVGTGQALELGRRGDVDLVLVHARTREDAFVADGSGVDRRDIMCNDFVLVGPAEDPANLRGAGSAAEAFRRIADAKALFVSRGDDSGTHIREQAIWGDVGAVPTGAFYLSAGQGMGACLQMADEKQAYTLTDRGTWLAYRGRLDSEVLFAGDPVLRNPYGAIIVNPTKHSATESVGAKALLDYLTSAAGQKRIGAFRVDGQTLFHPADTSQ